ncbi:tripartite tricarboxylate transporter TctB family protein [Georgenia sp. SUBG003]|uniref:tripartite tricarboxylate transporter TctB family protein n=1 Tax=Georgenia sp. SUBG003 TaxID=1497974 RepID=UPI003AB440EE
MIADRRIESEGAVNERPDAVVDERVNQLGPSQNGGSAPDPRSRRAVPLALAGLLVAVAVIIVIDVPGYKAGVGGEPGPATLPILIAVLCTIAAVALVIQTLRGAHESEEDPGPALTRKVVIGIAALIAAGLLLEQIGFFVVFTSLLFVAGWLTGARRWWSNLLVAAVATWIVMIIFGRLFAVPLPAAPIDVFLGG